MVDISEIQQIDKEVQRIEQDVLKNQPNNLNNVVALSDYSKRDMGHLADLKDEKCGLDVPGTEIHYAQAEL